MNQPYSTLERIGQWCETNNVDWAIAGSWSLYFQGVELPSPPNDLDIQIGLDDLTVFYAENPWLKMRDDSDDPSHAMVIEDGYWVDLWLPVSSFHRDTLARAKPIWRGVTAVDVMLHKFGRPVYDARGVEICKAIVDHRYKLKKREDDNGQT